MASAVDSFLLLNLKPSTRHTKPTNFSFYSAKRAPSLQIRADSMATERLGIKVEKNPPESKLTELGVRQWPKYFHFSTSFLAYFSPFNCCNITVSISAPKLLPIVDAIGCSFDYLDGPNISDVSILESGFNLSLKLMNVDK